MADDTNHSGIDVDLAGVTEFGNALRAEVERNLRPQAVDIVKDSQDYERAFGNPVTTPTIYAMRDSYHQNLSIAAANVRHYVTTAHLLVEAIERIVEAYASADGVSGDTAAKILAESAGLAASDQSYESVQEALTHISDVSVPQWNGGL